MSLKEIENESHPDNRRNDQFKCTHAQPHVRDTAHIIHAYVCMYVVMYVMCIQHSKYNIMYLIKNK